VTATVRIHYRRPPDRLQVYEQALVHDGPDVKVTLKEAFELPRPMIVADRVVAEPGAAIVWFTFPGLWHDIGRFHLADGTFTGLYANVLTPVELRGPHDWSTTDLFLDVWLDERGPCVLDEDELDEAVRRAWIDDATGACARREAQRILWEIEKGLWPPAAVHEWTLERARRAAAG
jgi:predicted RNA-binding protein associated with RNAse of E/G family